MVADTIKSLRGVLNLTQSELAKKLNITRSSVNAWELGISVPSTQYIVELSKIFSVSTDYLLNVRCNKNINVDNLSDKQIKMVYTLVQYFNEENNNAD